VSEHWKPTRPDATSEKRPTGNGLSPADWAATKFRITHLSRESDKKDTLTGLQTRP